VVVLGAGLAGLTCRSRAAGASRAGPIACRERSRSSSALRDADLRARRWFWNERGEDGDVETDLPTGRVRDETKLQPAEAGVLGACLSNDAARRMTALPEVERLRTFLEGAETAHPGAKAHYVAGVTKCWDEDPFARGAYAWFRPRQMTELGPSMASAKDACTLQVITPRIVPGGCTGPSPRRSAWCARCSPSAPRVVRVARRPRVGKSCVMLFASPLAGRAAPRRRRRRRGSTRVSTTRV
jgi:hypothetical protein